MTWLQTYTGKKVYPLDPDPESIDIIDIAHALSCQNRFLGHLRYPLNVAQHSCMVAALVPHDDSMAGLLHDAAEAYLGDVPTPLKMLPQYAFYREAEERLQQVIFRKFGLPVVIPASVHYADQQLLRMEAEQLLGPPIDNWTERFPACTMLLSGPIPPKEAEAEFLKCFRRYSSR